MENHLSCTKITTPHGPAVQFNYEQLVRLLVKSYGLVEEIATTTGGVELAWTLDGAKLTKKSGHVTGGFKLVD
jgi:hypothetical protein